MAAKGLFINSTEQGFTVRGVNNNFFPDNATLAYPANSVILITDESDMATFRSASNYDVLFSALIKDININEERVTKDNIIETFNEAANKPSGGGGNPDAFTSVEYDGTKSLIFYNDKGDEVANVDVTPFIKDGMVSNVEILNGNLVITFNTDSGKQPITIPLTDIFNPNNYYNKTESDSRFASQTVVNQEIAARIQGDADINTALGAKADKSDTYTKSQIDALIPDTSDFVSKSEYNPKEVAIAEALTDLNENKADKTEIPDVSTLATKTELNAKQDTLEYYSEEVENDYANITIEGTNEDGNTYSYVDVYNTDVTIGFTRTINDSDYGNFVTTDTEGVKIQSQDDEGEISLKVNPVGVTINDERVLTESDGVYYINFGVLSQQGITDADWDGMVAAISARRPIYAGLGDRYYTAECLYRDGSNIIRMTASDELSHYFYMFTKRGTNDYTMTYEVRPYVTEVEKHNWSAKQDALISGTNIKTVNNQSILGEGNIEIQGGGMDEDTELLISSALVDLNNRKIDANEVKENYQKKGDYATNAKVDTKANISDVPTNEDYEEAQKITSWSLNDLNARFGGVRLQIITQSDYEALATKDNNTLYVIRTE